MKITKIEKTEQWMLDKVSDIKEIRTMHELALCAVMHNVVLSYDLDEFLDTATIPFRKDEITIDGIIGSCGLFQDGSLHGVSDDLICMINNKMYFYKESYITKSGHVMLIVKEWHDLNDYNDHTSIVESENIYFLVEGV